jgi:hypothetical protein
LCCSFTKENGDTVYQYYKQPAEMVTRALGMSGMKSVKLGRLGEKRFSELCTQQGATCNSSSEDEHGWDYIVEVDPGHQTMLPADLRDGIIRSLVQVKTKQGNKRVAKIKLSNALKAIQTDLPCFLVLVVFEGPNLTGLFVRHFWSAEIERVLKRAREAYRDGRSDLHKIELQFSLEDCEDVQSNLIEALCSCFCKHGTSYGQNKKAIRDNVGYSETRAVGEFTFEDGVTAKDIVDWQLSDDAQLTLKHFAIRDMRFDIPASTVERPTQGSKISVQPTPQQGVLRIVKGNRSLELDAKIYFPALVGPEHKDFKVRIKTALLDMKLPIGRSGTLQAKVIYELDTVWDYYVAAEFAAWDQNVPVEFQVECDAGGLFNGHFGSPLKADERSEKIANGGRVAVFLAGRQELIDLSPDHDRIWRQISWLAQFEAVLGELPKKLTFLVDAPLDTDCQHVLAFVVFQLGDFYHSVNVAFPIHHQNIEGQRWEVFFDQAEVLNSKRFKTDYTNMRRVAQQGFEHLIETRKKAIIFLGSGDLIDWFSDEKAENDITVHVPD